MFLTRNIDAECTNVRKALSLLWRQRPTKSEKQRLFTQSLPQQGSQSHMVMATPSALRQTQRKAGGESFVGEKGGFIQALVQGWGHWHGETVGE